MSKIGPRQTVERAQRNQWAGEINLVAKKIALGMRTLEAASSKDGKIPGGLASTTMLATNEAVDMLKTLLEQRFDVHMTDADLSTLQSAAQTLKKAYSHFQTVEKKADDARIPPDSQEYKGHYWTIDAAAMQMSEAANKSGVTQYVNFNGTNLIVRPGQSPHDSVHDWLNVMAELRDNPVDNFAWQVESRATDEATRTALDKLAKQQPQSLDKVLARAQKSSPIEHEVLGPSIDAVVRDMMAIASYSGQQVHAKINDIDVLASPGDTFDQVMAPVNKMAEQARIEIEKLDAEQKVARQKRLAEFTAQGGKVIDTPPDGMSFDKRGLLMPGYYLNRSSRPLQLVTKADFNQMPDGTKLTCIDGRECIKGIDYIDNETSTSSSGFIAYGFLQ